MSQNFKLKFDEMLNNAVTRPQTEKESAGREMAYQHASHVRNVNFVLANGDMVFLNYGYLISGKYGLAENCIQLSFASHEVKLGGIFLIPLYFDFMKHIPENVICVDVRYNATVEKDKPVVNTIVIEKKGS